MMMRNQRSLYCGLGLLVLLALVTWLESENQTLGQSSLGEVGKNQTCLECHAGFSPKIIEAWRHSKHASKQVGCESCHGTDHSTIFERKGKVSSKVCAECHAKQAREFDASLHAQAADFARSDPKFARL